MNIEGILRLQEAHGAKAKAEVLKQYADDNDFKTLLYATLNPMISYHVSEQSLRNETRLSGSGEDFSSFQNVCFYLSNASGVSNAVLQSVKDFLNEKCSVEERELFIRILAKTLRLGVTGATVNKVIPDLIPVWEVQQAYPIEKYPLKENVWFSLTQKLNGVRATYYNGKLYARSGTPYEGLEHIISCIKVGFPSGYVFDGELTLRDKGTLSDNEAFRMATGIINSDAPEKKEIGYTVFDMIPTSEFNGTPTTLYQERRAMMNALNDAGNGSVKILPVLYSGTDQSMIPQLLDRMVREDKEGLMVNLNVPYQRKRHSGILKVKRFYTMDLPIIGMEEGSGKLAGTLGDLVLDYKGNEVRVGSGFTDEERRTLWNDGVPDGALCEVKYKEVSYDKSTGAESLQFPVFVRIRDDKQDVSYA